MLSIFNALMPLVVVVLIGVFLKLKVANDSWVGTLNAVALYVLFPALVLRGITQVKVDTFNDLGFIFINLLLLLLIISLLIFGGKALKIKKEIANSYVITVFFGNIGYLGFPIITSLYSGVEAIISIHIAIYTMLLFSVVVIYLEYTKSGKIEKQIFIEGLKNPLLLSVIVSIVIVSFNIILPHFLVKSIEILANGATPTVLIALGIFLAKQLPKISYKHLIGITILKLLIVPLIFLAILQFYHTKAFEVSVLEAAMPVAITPFVLADIYPLDKNLIAGAIVVSSILSLITLPIFILALGA